MPPERLGCAGSAIDHRVLDRLADDLGDSAVMVMVVELYLEHLESRSVAVVAAIQSGDGAGAQRDAHTLKGPSLMLGANDLGALCESIEISSVELTSQVVTDLGRLVQWARLGLQAWIDEIELRR